MMSKKRSIDLNFNPFPSSVVFHVETNNLICRAKQMTGFCKKCSTGLKLVNSV